MFASVICWWSVAATVPAFWASRFGTQPGLRGAADLRRVDCSPQVRLVAEQRRKVLGVGHRDVADVCIHHAIPDHARALVAVAEPMTGRSRTRCRPEPPSGAGSGRPRSCQSGWSRCRSAGSRPGAAGNQVDSCPPPGVGEHQLPDAEGFQVGHCLLQSRFPAFTAVVPVHDDQVGADLRRSRTPP